MMRYFFLFCLLVVGQGLWGQAEKVNRKLATLDNFNWVMGLEEVTRPQLDSAYKIVASYKFVNLDTFDILNIQLLETAKKLDNTDTYARLLELRAWRIQTISESKKYEEYYQQALEIYSKTNNQSGIADIKLSLANRKSQLQQYNLAIDYFLEALESLTALSDTFRVVKTNLYIGQTFLRMGYFNKAAEYQIDALTLSEQANMKNFVMFSKDELANTYKEQLINIVSNPEQDALMRDSISLLLENARNNTQEAYDLAKELGIIVQQRRCLVSLIDIERLSGNYKKALTLGKQSEEFLKRTKDIEADIVTRIYIGKTYFDIGDIQLAQQYIESAENLIKKEMGEVDIPELEQDIQKVLYKIYKKKDDYKRALTAFERLHRVQIDNMDKENTAAVFYLETQYQTAQKEQEILQQRNDILELETDNAAVVKQRNYLLGGSLFLAIMTFFGYQLNKTRRERNDKIAFADALMYAQEEERKRIAHDLHDGIGQSLLLIKKQIENNQSVTMENRSMITQTLEEVRSMSRDLHPFQIEKFGLTESITDMIRKVDKSTDLFITKEIVDVDQAFPEKQQIHVFRAIQEAFNNIVKHSEATAAKVTIEKFSKIVLITILDNGIGFDYELAVARSKSLGLRTMYERVTNIGGELKFSRNNPKGTKVEIRIPV